MKNRYTFITGLPRSRQAWTAAFLDGANERTRTRFDSPFTEEEKNDSYVIKVSCGSGNLYRVKEILDLKRDPRNEVCVIFIQRDRYEAMGALFNHLSASGITLLHNEKEVISENIMNAESDFISNVPIQAFFPFKEFNNYIEILSIYACNYRPTKERIELFKRLRISEIISPEQREHLLSVIGRMPLPGNEEKQCINSIPQSTETYGRNEKRVSYGGNDDHRYSPCPHHSNQI